MKICLVGALVYDYDNRTMRYAEALRERGDEVDVISIRGAGQSHFEVVKGVNVLRILERKRTEKNKFTYLYRLTLFLVKSFFVLSWRHLWRRYDVIHVHSVPDFEVFAAAFAKLLGAKVILDIYDVSPEFFLSKFDTGQENLYFKLLLLTERLSCRFAHHVIAANDIWYEKLMSRSVPRAKCSVFLNYIDPRIFYPRKRTRTDNRFILIYPGVLQWHQGVDIAVRAFGIVKKEIPDAEFHIYGVGNQHENLLELVRELKLEESVLFKQPVVLTEIPQVMANADIGVVGKRSDVFGNEAYSTKITEYMSQAIPVVAPRTKIDSHYFNENLVHFFEPGNHEDMAAKIIELSKDKLLRARLVGAASEYVSHNNWDHHKKRYLELIDGLKRTSECAVALHEENSVNS